MCLPVYVEYLVHLVGDRPSKPIHRADRGDPLTDDVHVPVRRDPAVRVNGDHIAVA
jgi:hypothetical protein